MTQYRNASLLLAGIVFLSISEVSARPGSEFTQEVTPAQAIEFVVKVEGRGTTDDQSLQFEDRFSFVALSGNKISLTSGQAVPVVSGVTMTGQGRSVSNYVQVQIGAMLSVKATVLDDQILADIKLEKTWLEKTASEEPEYAQSVTNSYELETAIRLSEGAAESIESQTSGGVNGPCNVRVTVTARIRD